MSSVHFQKYIINLEYTKFCQFFFFMLLLFSISQTKFRRKIIIFLFRKQFFKTCFYHNTYQIVNILFSLHLDTFL